MTLIEKDKSDDQELSEIIRKKIIELFLNNDFDAMEEFVNANNVEEFVNANNVTDFTKIICQELTNDFNENDKFSSQSIKLIKNIAKNISDEIVYVFGSNGLAISTKKNRIKKGWLSEGGVLKSGVGILAEDGYINDVISLCKENKDLYNCGKFTIDSNGIHKLYSVSGLIAEGIDESSSKDTQNNLIKLLNNKYNFPVMDAIKMSYGNAEDTQNNLIRLLNSKCNFSVMNSVKMSYGNAEEVEIKSVREMLEDKGLQVGNYKCHAINFLLTRAELEQGREMEEASCSIM